MRSKRRNAPIAMIALAGLILAMSAPTHGQSGRRPPPPPAINPPPFDWSDSFYTANGVNVTELDTAAAGRFGLFRQTGTPAVGQEVNWKTDGSNTSPIHNSTRILATVGGYDYFGNDQYITINAFANDQNFFLDNAAGQRMLAIATPFQAYFAPRQKMANGQFAFQPYSNPAGTPITSNVTGNPIGGTTNFFPSSPDAATERSDKFFDIAQSHYFCDDLIGMWLITYYYWLPSALTNPPPAAVAALGAKNGLSLDGTPIIRTPNDLDTMEGLGYADEYNLPADGSQGPDVPGGKDGPVFLVCPAIPDASSGAIASDAFLDAVKTSSGNFFDPTLAANFKSLQTSGNYSTTTSSSTVQATITGTHTLAPASAPGNRLNNHHAVAVNGNPVTVSAANGTAAQNWTFSLTNPEPFPGNTIITNSGAGYPQTVPNSFYTLKNGVGNFNLDVPGGNVQFVTAGGQGVDDGIGVDIFTNDGSVEETWNLVKLSNGYYLILSGVSLDNALEVAPDGVSVDISHYTGGANQQWILH